jgi:membrane fusion protein
MGGIVRALAVHEGSIVRKGQAIAIIAVDREIEHGRGYAGMSLSTLDTRIGIADQRLGLARDELRNDRAKLSGTIAAAAEQAASLREQITLQADIVESNRVLFDQLGGVVSKGFISKAEYERRHQQLLASQQSLSTLRQSLLAREAEAAQARTALAGLATQEKTTAAGIATDVSTLQQQRAEVQSRIQYVVTAPLSGVVTALQTAVGRVAEPSTPLMAILPTDSRLVAEVYAPTSAIGFVQPNQEVRILYDAFPYRQFGSVSGHVASISRDVIDPRHGNVPVEAKEPVYKLLIRLDDQELRTQRGPVRLQAGMVLQANVILERQSFMDWLLAPLHAFSRRTS